MAGRASHNRFLRCGASVWRLPVPWSSPVSFVQGLAYHHSQTPSPPTQTKSVTQQLAICENKQLTEFDFKNELGPMPTYRHMCFNSDVIVKLVSKRQLIEEVVCLYIPPNLKHF